MSFSVKKGAGHIPIAGQAYPIVSADVATPQGVWSSADVNAKINLVTPISGSGINVASSPLGEVISLQPSAIVDIVGDSVMFSIGQALRFNDWVTLNLGEVTLMDGLEAQTWTEIATVPDLFRPRKDTAFSANILDGNFINPIVGRILQTGEITIFCQVAVAANATFGPTITYQKY